MNNPEHESDILKSIDKSGYSELQTDLQIDRKRSDNRNVKQFNRQTKKSTQQSKTIILKKKKPEVIFQAE